MAIVINSHPVDYSSAHGDLVFVVYEATKANDPVTYVNYKYTCDIYVAGVKVVTLKTFPNPVNKRGIFNIGNIVRNYVSATFDPAYNAVKAQEFSSFYASVQCKFGEEYGGVEYTNLTVDSARKFFNHYNDRLVGGYTILDNYVDAPASNRSLITQVLYGAPYVFIPYFPTSTSAIGLVVKAYNAAGMMTANNTINVTPSAAYYLQQLNLSANAINTAHGGAIPTDTVYYTVDINGGGTYRFNIYCEPRYTPITVHFLNKFGGYDSFDFPKVSKKGVDITKKDFTQLGYTIDPSGIMSYYSPGGNVLSENRTVFYGNSKERRKLNTDYITEGTYNWLQELVRSPQVYISLNNYLIPIVITETSYEFKTMAVDRLFNLTINIEFGDDLNVQYR
jgi:hypothetical protein